MKLIFEFKPFALRSAGTDPLMFLVLLREMGFSVSEIDEQNGELLLLSDPDQFLTRGARDRGFSLNLFAERRQSYAP